MTQYSDYLAQVFEKLGTPLLAVTMEQSAQNPASGTNEAELIASLLGKTTQLGISLSELVDMPEKPEDSDAARLTLAALSAPLVANQYRISNRMPEDKDLEKALEALKTVMTYSDNFTSTEQGEERLKTLEKDNAPGDKTQQQVRYLHTLLPAINSVMAFPFGQKEQKMAQDVTDKLVQRTKQMCDEIFPDIAEDVRKETELSLLRSIVMIYSQCHFAEMARLMAQPDEDRMTSPSTDALWTAFETRVAMLETISLHMVPGADKRQSGTTQDTVAPTAPAQAPPQPIPQTPPPAQESPAAPPADNGNPMSFFSKPPADSSDGGNT